MNIIAYYRVSTQKQGRSGLGLEAQRAAVEEYARSHNGRVLAAFTEVESGKNNDRPELRKAIARARAHRATLVIAKLDRLARNAAFTLMLKDSLAETGTKFVAADMPDANNMTIGIMAVIAQQEREAISARTKAALAAKKRALPKGQRLGNPNGAAALRRANKGNAASVQAIKANADQRAECYRPIIEELREAGAEGLGAIAKGLNDAAIPSPRGGAWHKSSVGKLLDRLGMR